MRFTRITVNAAQMGGAPCIRGLRIPVSTVVGMVAEGMTEAEIVDPFPDVEPEDIREALRYAAEAVRERELPLTSPSPNAPGSSAKPCATVQPDGHATASAFIPLADGEHRLC